MKTSLRTGQTGQMSERTAYFEISQDQDAKWHWVLWSGNGRMMARNPDGYERRKDVVQAIKNLVKLVPSVRFIAAGSGTPREEEIIGRPED